MPCRTWGRKPRAAALLLALAGVVPALAQTPAAPALTPPASDAPATPPPVSSALDAPLFYQLLIGELELRQGQPGTAFEVILDAARRTRDEQLFRRAVEIALQGRAGDQALVAVRAWRLAQPLSTEALRTQLQILGAMNRVSDIAEPLRSLLALTPEGERGSLIAAIPRFLQRSPDAAQAARLIDELLEPYRRSPATRVAALVASGRAWALAGDTAQALTRVREAQQADAASPGPVLLALDLMAKSPEAAALVTAQMQGAGVDPAMRMAYARALMGNQRLVEAAAQLDQVTREHPELAPPYLSLGALQLELRHPAEAETALQRFLQLSAAEAPAAAASAASAAAADSAADAAASDDEADETAEAAGDNRDDSRTQGVIQAWLMLAQAAEQRGDYAAAESWLARIDDPRRALDVQTRRAGLLAAQGRVDEARELIRRAPERETGDARAKLLAEAAVLREVKRWDDAYEVLGRAVQRFPEDADLIYEQAMVAEKMNRVDDMERMLRQVIGLKPDNAHAHNALGYSLADRGQRLPEARDLIQRALDLSPGDPFITDSLGWVEFRLGNLAEATRLLRQAYASRPDVEIGAHLGEVLWMAGQRDEARRIWKESRARDAANDVLHETLKRLKVDL